MNLEIIKLRTTWNDAAGSINSNYAKIADAIAQLKANGGGGGGGADIDLTDYASKVWVEAKGYITASALTPYALKTDIPSLVGYATEDFVNNKLEDYATQDYVTTKLVDYAPLTSVQGFENRIGGLEGAVPQLNARVTTNEAQIEQLVSTKLDSSYFTLTNIKSTLGISDWALASVKPTYTASEVGALGVKDTAQQSYGLRHSTTPISDTGLHWWSGQFQVSTEPVSGKVYLGSSGDYTVISVPKIDGTSSLANACVLRLGYNRQFFHEIFTSPNSNNIYHRNVHIGNGNPWRQFAFTTDIPTKLSQLTDDVVAGRYLPLSGGTLNGSITATSFIGNLTGNAGSATKLQTPRKLWGNDFDGTGDVSGSLYSDRWRIIKDSTWNGTFIQSANYDGTSDLGNIYMSAMGGNKLTSFNVWANDSKFSNNVTVAGNVGIGNTSPTERLDVSGNVKASGNINATSITINGVTITASNGSITVNGNVFATGDITGGV